MAAAFTTALESDIHIMKTYELGGPDLLDLMQIIKKISQAIEKKTILTPIPIFMVAPVVALAQAFGITLPVTSDQLIMLGEDNIRTGGDPMEALGIEWTGFEEGIRTYLSVKRE